MADVIYLDTYVIMGHYDINNDRVEISANLKQYAELHSFVLNHELGHREIQNKYGVNWRHLWHDYKDRFSLFWDNTLRTQYFEFHKFTNPQNATVFAFMLIYQLSNFFSAIVTIPGRVRGIRKWLKNLGKIILE